MLRVSLAGRRPDRGRRVLLRLGGLAALTLAVMLALAPPALAHASLEGGSVTDGQVLDVAPEELFLEFNEPVEATTSGLRVFATGGERVDQGGTFQTADAPDLVRVELDRDLANGTYAVTYRVTSADGHPIDGAMIFSVGQEASGAEDLLEQVFGGDSEQAYAIAAMITRWVGYVAVLVVAGVLAAAWWLSGTARDALVALTSWLRRGAIAVVVTAVLTVVWQTILVGGDGLGSLADTASLSATLTSFVGWSAAARAVGGALVWMALRRWTDEGAVGVSGLAAVGAGVALGSFLFEGHTLTTEPAAVVWSAAAIHLATTALWTGGLVLLFVVLRIRRRADDPVGAGRTIARFSALFTVSVVAVLGAGAALSWVEVRAARALFSTSYGLVLVAKVALVGVLVAIGAYNNRRLVPVLTARRARQRAGKQPVIAGGSDEVADKATERDRAWAHLGMTVFTELGAIVAVLALTGALVALQPAAEAAGVTGAYSETVEFDGIGQMTFTVDPNVAGQNEIHIYLLGETGRPVDVAESVTLLLSHPELDIGPIEREPTIAGPGHYLLAGPELNQPGVWEITTEVALTRFDIVSETISVTVNE
ncbi:copper resistance CopC/CopD family protein [Euzebya tangerina]|uniref:copper resistance CopC/CopD family protein n=1 Tax=Euzebya tangerina TaxID=591198 RepID=UPI0013C2F1FA|nr:copper resistance protein CopC [Euzebya tangerina]